MKYYIGTIIVIVFLTVISSCTAVQEATVFDRTVSYYREQGDTLKMRAAEFLRDYSDYHYGVERHWVDSIGETVEKLDYHDFLTDTMMVEFLRSGGYRFVEGRTVDDRDTVTDDFLRRNIDMAFDSWHQPWAQGIPFDDFCRFILPYRVGDEALSGWREYFKQRYEPTIADSVSDPTSLRQVALYLMRCIRRDVEYGGSMGLFNRYMLTHTQMMQLHWLECMGCAQFTTMAMRACGVPCAMIEINWRFTEVKHFSVLFPKAGDIDRPFRLSVGDTLIYMGEPKDSMAAWQVWEYDYQPDHERMEAAYLYRDNNSLKQILSTTITLSDITPLMCRTYDFALPVPDSLRHEKYLFLCRFHDWKWLPVREGRVVGDSVMFQHATIRQWYRLGYADADSIRTFGQAFTLLGNQDIRDIHERIRPYDLSGDTILFRLAYRDKVKDATLSREITTYYWDDHQQWHPLTGNAILWGFNPSTGEYREYKDVVGDKGFRPDFHLMDVRLPRWTVFFDDELGNPYGFINPDTETGEGCLMQF